MFRLSKIKKLRFILKYISEKYNNIQLIAGLMDKYKCFIDETVLFQYDSIDDIIINKNVHLSRYCTITVINRDKNNKISKLLIGENTSFGDFCDIRSAGGRIEIGKNCLIAQNVHFIAANHLTDVNNLIRDNAWDEIKNYIKIGDDVWIGCNCILLPGIEVGEGSVIAAGSVVTKDIKPYTVVGGNPAKFIKNRK